MPQFFQNVRCQSVIDNIVCIVAYYGRSFDTIRAWPSRFYNTGISTYVWILTNRKPKRRKGKIQLINATGFWGKMRRSLGEKRKEIGESQIDQIASIFGDAETSKLFDNIDFGYNRITVERPLRLNFAITAERIEAVKAARAFQGLSKTKKKDMQGEQEAANGRQLRQDILDVLEARTSHKVENSRESFSKALRAVFKAVGMSVACPPAFKAALMALSERDETADICTDKKGNPEPDADLRDFENVPLKGDIQVYFRREILPHVPDAWIDEAKTKVGYEIPFTRHFYRYEPPRPLVEIDADLRVLGRDVQKLLTEVIT